MPGFDMSEYVDVAERISEFSAKYPEGSLQSELKPLERDGILVGWWCRAYAYRTPDDLRPGIGHAIEPVPGKTPYTRDSEAMNAETSAWGRAIIALGFRTKKVASAQEVEARREQDPAQGTPAPAKRARKPEAKKAVAGPAAGTEEKPKYATKEQRQKLFDTKNELGVSDTRLREILELHTGQRTTSEIPADKFAAVYEAVELEVIPFA